MLFGFFIVNQFGRLGIVRITETLILSLSIIISMCFFVTIFPSIGTNLLNQDHLSQFSGLVMNRNAFAFQLLICSALYVVFAPFLGAHRIPDRGRDLVFYAPLKRAQIPHRVLSKSKVEKQMHFYSSPTH